mgnify:CR=1 FL=1
MQLGDLMNKKEIIKILDKEYETHRNYRDPDGFCDCSEMDVRSYSVAPKGEWLGDEKSRKNAMKHHRKELKEIRCEFCSLVRKLKRVIK